MNTNKSFVFLDLETTGYNPTKDMIYQIGVVRYSKGAPTQSYATYVNPACQLLPLVRSCTDYEIQSLRNAPTITQVIMRLREVIGHDTIVGHNIRFDLCFLAYACRLYGLSPIDNDWIDTLTLAHQLLPGKKHYKLSDVAMYLGIRSSVTHDALDDAFVTSQVFFALKSLQGG